MPSFTPGCLRWLALLALLPPLSGGAQTKIPIGAELERLAATHGFIIEGLSVTGEALGRSKSDDLLPRLRALLADFDHIIVQGPQGKIDKVIIMGEKALKPPPPPPTPAPATSAAPSPGASPPISHIELKTTRRGTQHAIQVSLEGEGGKKVTRELVLDTGADFVVLPSSLLSALGIPAAGLQPSEMQTANGKIQARIGNMPAIWLGNNRVENIRVAFLDDVKLGASGLLGMSLLSRYNLTIDERSNRLILDAKAGSKTKVAEGGTNQGAQPQQEGKEVEPPVEPTPDGAIPPPQPSPE